MLVLAGVVCTAISIREMRLTKRQDTTVTGVSAVLASNFLLRTADAALWLQIAVAAFLFFFYLAALTANR